jgi:hypothetical protein
MTLQMMEIPKNEPWFSDPLEDPDEAEKDPRYIELNEELDRLDRNDSFAKGRLYCQVRDEKQFGRWGSFRDFVIGRRKESERQAFYLMNAAETFDLLKINNCQLPINERQCRPLRRLRGKDELKVLAWIRACTHEAG